MKLPFRQGIVRYQTDVANTPTFLQRATNGDFVDLIVSPDPTIITIAHGNANYTIEESYTVRNAWGPFQTSGQTQYLYWDIDLLTGNLSRGASLYSPVSQATEPVAPLHDQHWFDTSTMTMKVWYHPVGSIIPGKWLTKIRLFAGVYSSGGIIEPYNKGSHVGSTIPCFSGYLLKDHLGQPLRANDGTFLTTESQLYVTNAPNPSYPIKVETILLYAKASEYIPKFSLVTLTGGNTMHLGRSSMTDLQLTGIVNEEYYPGEVGVIIRVGVVSNDQWTFAPADIGKPFFCGPTGELSLTAPTSGFVQQCGIVTDKDQVYMDIKQPLYWD